MPETLTTEAPAKAASAKEPKQAETVCPSEIDALIAEHGTGPEAVIPILQGIQSRFR